MKTPPVVVLWLFATAAFLLADPPVQGQTPGAAPPAWQPFRESLAAASAVDGVGGPIGLATTAEDGSMRMAQALVDESTMVCPQPLYAAPPCEFPAYVDMSAADGAPPTSPGYWYWRLLPEGVIWQSYWAGVHEPRLSGIALNERSNDVNYLDGTVGGRTSIVRYGTEGPGRPQGAELQIEGAAFPRLNLDENWDLDATDFRVGFPLIYGREKWQTKFSYYHLSSHSGDEFIIREDAADERINFSRDTLVLGLSFFPLPAWRWYAEAGWAFYDDVARQWELQFGVDVSEPGPTGFAGTPFIAINGHLRQELDYGGNVVAQAGWLWRGSSTRTLRAGIHYYNGKSSQFEFFDQFEEQIGGGLWYDF